MTAPAGDPVFVLACAIGEALVDVDAIQRWADHAEDGWAIKDEIARVGARLRAAQEIGLDVQVATTAPCEGQEVLW